MPINKLKTAPECEATLVDITCDSDGKVDRFIDFEDTSNTLPLHDIQVDESGHLKDDYYLGFFLLVAYDLTKPDPSLPHCLGTPCFIPPNWRHCHMNIEQTLFPKKVS